MASGKSRPGPAKPKTQSTKTTGKPPGSTVSGSTRAQGMRPKPQGGAGRNGSC